PARGQRNAVVGRADRLRIERGQAGEALRHHGNEGQVRRGAQRLPHAHAGDPSTASGVGIVITSATVALGNSKRRLPDGTRPQRISRGSGKSLIAGPPSTSLPPGAPRVPQACPNNCAGARLQYRAPYRQTGRQTTRST